MTKISPAQLGYRIPPEWEEHASTLLIWPSNRETWPGERLESVEKVYIEIIETLHLYEPIHLIVNDKSISGRVEDYLRKRNIDRDRVTLHIRTVNDVWARDCGPVFIKKEEQGCKKFAITDWEYNAWGGKYPPYDDDNQLPFYISEYFGLPRFKTGMVLEGGSIEVNSEGVLLTTESVLLNPNRNPGLSKSEIEDKLRENLGIKKVIWLKAGLAGDDTDGHVDDLARFLNDRTILVMEAGDAGDVNYDTLQSNLEILENARNLDGRPFKLEKLTLPETRIEGTTVDGSKYVPASYANYYVANKVVLVPNYNNKTDKSAMNLFKKYFPDHRIAGIQCRDLIWGQGSIHCITQQMYGTDPS